MRKRASGRWALSTLLALVAAGCGGDDDPTEPESELTQAEAMAVFSEVLSAVFMASAGAGQELEGPDGLAAVPQTFTVDLSAPCQGGGTIALTGTYVYDVDQSGSGSYSYDIVETPDDCGVTTGTGTSYVVNGSPNIQFAGSYSFLDGTPQGVFDMAFTGGLAWTASNGGASGSCSINLVYAFNWNGQSGSVQGSICGHNINTTF